MNDRARTTIVCMETNDKQAHKFFMKHFLYVNSYEHGDGVKLWAYTVHT
jgi:hypothetical protein